MMRKLLVANRGVAAARILRAARSLDIDTVAIHSEVDLDLPYVSMATEARCVGGPSPRDSYLVQERIIEAATQSGCDSIHPGYGFLSENAEFAAKVRAAGLVFVGPPTDLIETLGNKAKARDAMVDFGVPVVASSPILPSDPDAAFDMAAAIGYPLIIKPIAGGGGIGMISVAGRAELRPALDRARALAERSFGDGRLFVERRLKRPRHIEFQVIADQYGAVAHLYERDCSIQRRNQKVLEETPAPNLPRALLDGMASRVANALGEMGYQSLGTVEMLYENGEFSFLEVNTRLQVEHAVTEEITGIDLVVAQLRIAAGAPLKDALGRPVPSRPEGHSVQARIYSEDPVRFLPSAGHLDLFDFSACDSLRVEAGYKTGNTVTTHYDPMLAKVIAHGRDRREAISKLVRGLRTVRVEGVRTNIPFILDTLENPSFLAGDVHTRFVDEMPRTTVQPAAKSA